MIIKLTAKSTSVDGHEFVASEDRSTVIAMMKRKLSLKG